MIELVEKIHYCYYHPDSKAVENCDRCHKLICLPDKRTYSNSISFGKIKPRTFQPYDSKYIFCPPCYFEISEQNLKRTNNISRIPKSLSLVLIFPILFIALFFGIFFVIVGESEIFYFLFAFFGIFFLIAFLIFFIVFRSTKLSQNGDSNEKLILDEDKRNFFASLESNKRVNDEYNFGKLVCFQCGSPIDKNDMYCGVCGDSTKDELHSIS